MGFQSVPDTCLFTAHFTGPNGTHPSFSLASRNLLEPWNALQQGELADAFLAALTDDYLPILSTDHTLVRITSRDLEQEFPLIIEHEAVNLAGGLASPSLPAEVAVKVTCIGAPGSAPRRGGWFFLPPAESQVTGSLLTTAAVDEFQAAAEALHNSMSASGPAHVMISRYSGTSFVDLPSGERVKRATKRPVAVTNTIPTVIVKNRVDSQKNRRPREV